jgi:hypothetical protein
MYRAKFPLQYLAHLIFFLFTILLISAVIHILTPFLYLTGNTICIENENVQSEISSTISSTLVFFFIIYYFDDIVIHTTCHPPFFI